MQLSRICRILIIENDFGQVNFDTQLLGTTGVNIRELTSGCICCSLQGDFKTALLQTLDQLDVDAIYIETSGVGKLSDILSACESPEITAIAHVQAAITIIDATNAPLFIRNFGEFFKDQVSHGDALFLTHQELPEQVELTIKLLRELNASALSTQRIGQILMYSSTLQSHCSPRYTPRKLVTVTITMSTITNAVMSTIVHTIMAIVPTMSFLPSALRTLHLVVKNNGLTISKTFHPLFYVPKVFYLLTPAM